MEIFEKESNTNLDSSAFNASQNIKVTSEKAVSMSIKWQFITNMAYLEGYIIINYKNLCKQRKHLRFVRNVKNKDLKYLKKTFSLVNKVNLVFCCTINTKNIAIKEQKI